MTSSTTARRSATDHKATTNQRAGTVQKASEQHGTMAGQGERGKAEVERASSGSALLMGMRLPGRPTRDNLLWWGGLAALAALEVVDWPVAAVVAVGTWIAEQHVKQPQQLVGAEAAS